MSIDWASVLFGFAAGAWISAVLTNLRWAANAKVIQRIECYGKLYKVQRADPEPLP